MLKKIQKNKESGFTIIEVLIVLAIAGLILLIVFLAVPALQRNSRNNSRKNDASRIATELANYASNNNGALAGTINPWATDCATVATALGNLGAYGSPQLSSWCQPGVTNGNYTPTLGTFVADNVLLGDAAFGVTNGTAKLTAPATGDALVYLQYATCNNANISTNTITINESSSARSSVLAYTLETAGNSTWGCISST